MEERSPKQEAGVKKQDARVYGRPAASRDDRPRKRRPTPVSKPLLQRDADETPVRAAHFGKERGEPNTFQQLGFRKSVENCKLPAACAPPPLFESEKEPAWKREKDIFEHLWELARRYAAANVSHSRIF